MQNPRKPNIFASFNFFHAQQSANKFALCSCLINKYIFFSILLIFCLCVNDAYSQERRRRSLLDLAPSGHKDVVRSTDDSSDNDSSRERSNATKDNNSSSQGEPSATYDLSEEEQADSAIMAPMKVKQYGYSDYGELTATDASLDLNDPDNVISEVEYQPATGYYILHTKIGDVDIATPYLMSDDEYRKWSEREAMRGYWQKKVGEVEHDNERKFDITDMKFNIGPADKIFGPGGVQLKLQGSAELQFGFKHQHVENPALTQRAKNNNSFDFDEKIQASVNASVGDKLKFNLNYNTESSFDFDRQNLKLAYKGQEDDIIQSIEAGNVSMSLNSNLITGPQALFGVKADLKFGKLRVQALLSQQNSESQTVSSQGGAQTTNFEITADSYDENRHFFLSYFFRDNYEKAMQSLPYIASGVTINKIEVWVTNKRGNYDQARNILAFTDLGESDASHLLQQDIISTNGGAPSNQSNTLYSKITSAAGVRDLQQSGSALSSIGVSDSLIGEAYEKVESARLLSSSEYTLNSALGYISLKAALNQDEVLAVAYEFTYGSNVYQVGEFSTDGSENLKAPNALILKLLKTSGNAPQPYNPARHGQHYGTWDLMMKNIYSLGTSQMQQDKFELYIMYRNDSLGTNVQYLPESQIKGKQLLRVLSLDRLDSRNKKSPDGKFDYVEGYTAQSSTGRIIFPVLEPFGSALRDAIGDDAIASKYVFQELYDSTLVSAAEMSERNKFTLQGKYKGSSGSQIQLGAMNVPRGSVSVTAGGATLTENVDYTVDYTMGTVTILNQAILDAGTNVDVKLENQSTFSMQRKSLMGAHIEYEFNKDLTVGGTIMHMTERPLTTKVNTGSEPLNNTVWGLNANWKTEFMWLTNAIDRVPWITATQPSSFQINAEFAQLIPGHTKEVGKAGTAYIDDFEATKTNIDIHYPNYWKLASTPKVFEESSKSNNIEYGKNRALLAWYAVDPIFGNPQSNTPAHIRNDLNALSDHRTRIIYEQEIYPNKDVLANEDTRLSVLNLSYYPSERGPYNIDTTVVDLATGGLANPQNAWAGIMRKIDNTDFEKSNIEYIEFWLLDPMLTNGGGNWQGGDLYINLGDISEDILKDGKKSFEHGLPVSDTDEGHAVEYTAWGRVPKTTSTTIAFSNDAGARAYQDVGLNGLNDTQEYDFIDPQGRTPYKSYVDYLSHNVSSAVLNEWRSDPFSPLNDPAGDNYHYYRGSDFDERQTSVLERYKHYNGTQGNSPESAANTENYGTAATLQPDIEDINSDNTLNENEKYYTYHVRLKPGEFYVGNQNITEKLETKVTLKNGNTDIVTWYQFKIPIRQYESKEGSIRNFKSIRFARIYLTGFSQETHLRFASFDLVRGEWRQCTKDLYPIDYPPQTAGSIDVQAINIEENANRSPINYVLPPGVTRQTDPGQAQLIAQNEQAMIMRVNNLSPRDARSVYKTTSYDVRQYKRLQMFVHAEKLEAIDNDLVDGELSCFIRMGSDMTQNYYEYEIPLTLTPYGVYNNDNDYDRLVVWPQENYFDFPFSVFTDAKVARNKAKRQGTSGVSNTIPYSVYDDGNNKPQNRITVMGNPTLEDIENIMIGIRNNSGRVVSGEIWVNELRMSEFNEQGGVAAMANAALSVSDIAQLNVAGRLETAGYGSIESNVLSRNMENKYQISVSAAMEGGRLFPEKAKLQIPLYVSYSNETISPDYDPLNTDLKLSETLETYETKKDRDSIRTMSNTIHESTNFTITGLKVNIHSKKRNMFYDPANFSISASYSKQNEMTPELEKNMTTDQKGNFTYSYSFNPKTWEPFKDMKGVQKPALKFVKEFNLYYLPQSWAFSTDMHRTFNHIKMRDFSQGDADMDITFSKDFLWNRNVDIKYDLTKNMKFSFQSAMNATIDEGYYTPEIIRDYAFTNDYYEAWKDTIQRSLAHWGSPYTYQQVFTASWNVPFNRFVGLDWITANASYNGTYNWNATVTNASDNNNYGNVVTSMRSWQVDGTLNFENLYNKSSYLKQVNQRFQNMGRNRRPFKSKTYTQTITTEAGVPFEVTHRMSSETLNVTATDKDGHAVKVSYKTAGNSKIMITTKEAYEGLTIKIETKDPNERTAAQWAGDVGIKFLTMIRRLQVTYRETGSLSVPGFYPEAGFMGQRNGQGTPAPGYDFAFGFFPSNFMTKAKTNNWLSTDTTIVQPATQANTYDFDVKLTLEPFPGFKIQVNGKRYQAGSTQINYISDYMRETFTGSYNITQVAIGSAFKRIGNVEDNFSSEVYDKFLENRDIMAERLQRQYDEMNYPDVGFISGTGAANQRYNRVNGQVSKTSSDVLIPAFLSAYTGKDVNSISFDPFLSILNILPNWSVTYDGLGKLPWMRDHFRSVTLTHAYTCKYSIGSYSSYSTWVPANGVNDRSMGFVKDVELGTPTPSSAYDISSVALSEQFSPLIGVNFAMKNSMTAKVEYRKQRNIALNVSSVQLTEGHTNELVVGWGYTIKDLNIFYKLKDGQQKKVSNDLKLSVDVSYKDVKTLLRKVEEGITQASAGNKVLGIKIAADYVLSSKINLRLYYDHQGTTPLISTSYPVSTDNVGMSIKLMLTR